MTFVLKIDPILQFYITIEGNIHQNGNIPLYFVEFILIRCRNEEAFHQTRLNEYLNFKMPLDTE